MNPFRVVRAGREQIDHQDVAPQVEGRVDLVHEVLDRGEAVLVARREDLDQGNDAMVADVPNRQGTPGLAIGGPGSGTSRHVTFGGASSREQGGRGCRVEAGTRRAIRNHLERQHVGDPTVRVLLGQGIKALGEEALVQGLHQMGDPGAVESMKRARVELASNRERAWRGSGRGMSTGPHRNMPGGGWTFSAHANAPAPAVDRPARSHGSRINRPHSSGVSGPLGGYTRRLALCESLDHLDVGVVGEAQRHLAALGPSRRAAARRPVSCRPSGSRARPAPEARPRARRRRSRPAPSSPASGHRRRSPRSR